MNVQKQNENGSWSDAEPVAPTFLFRVEMKLRSMGFKRLANLMARWDERKVGK